jgi:hypothetical protein
MMLAASAVAIAYCMCIPPAADDFRLDYECVPDTASYFDEASSWSLSASRCDASHASPFDLSYSFPWSVTSDDFIHPWTAPSFPLIRFEHSSADATSLRHTPQSGSLDLSYSLQVEGCACSAPTPTESQLRLSSVAPPNLVTLNDDGEVPPRLTPIDGERAARELKRAWSNVVGHRPSDDTLLILAAHWAHETSGGTFMYNYNFAGIKGRGASGLSCLREAHEGWGIRSLAGVDRFRAYLSASEGAEDYVSLLARKYPRAIEAARSGDILQFVTALRQGGYFTGSAAVYAQCLVELAERGQRSGYNALRMGAESSFGATSTMSSRIARRQ